MTEQNKVDKAEMKKLQKRLFENDFIKNIALSKFGDQVDRYGSFGKDTLDQTYMQTASTAPNQEAYEVLFGEAVLGNGSVTKEQLKINAMKVWSSSLAYQNTTDLAKKMGYSGQIDDKYSRKNLGELDEKDQQMISSSYLQYELTNLMKTGLDAEQKGLVGGLEKFLAPTKKTEEPDN